MSIMLWYGSIGIKKDKSNKALAYFISIIDSAKDFFLYIFFIYKIKIRKNMKKDKKYEKK